MEDFARSRDLLAQSNSASMQLLSLVKAMVAIDGFAVRSRKSKRKKERRMMRQMTAIKSHGK